jgi:hypothetical protein
MRTMNRCKPITEESRQQQSPLSMLAELTGGTLIDIVDRFGVLK